MNLKEIWKAFREYAIKTTDIELSVILVCASLMIGFAYDLHPLGLMSPFFLISIWLFLFKRIYLNQAIIPFKTLIFGVATFTVCFVVAFLSNAPVRTIEIGTLIGSAGLFLSYYLLACNIMDEYYSDGIC